MTAPRIHTVTGGDGVPLHVLDAGPIDAPAVVLIHGWAQSHASWQAQTGGALSGDVRTVAFDLRGHGRSGRPEAAQAYADGAPWAADVAAVLAALGLDRPVLCGWSYGARVIGEYLDRHGDADLGGIALVGPLLATGAARADWMVPPDSPGLARDLYTGDDARRLAASRDFLSACTAAPLPPALAEAMLAAMMSVSAAVRRALFAADRDLRPVFARTACPALIVHGAEDRVVAPASADALCRLMPQATLDLVPGTGHMPFLERPDRFDAALRGLLSGARAAA